jgi:hypothetical protein
MKIITVCRTAVDTLPILPLVAGLLIISTAALAKIRFEEVSAKAGMLHSGASQGASWGDFNGDGWPDLWVGNHYEPPSLYLNQQNGTFVDVIASVWSGDPQADKHGAAWADFDNDGDQDLLVLVGAVMGRGRGGNLLFVNQNGVLRDEAQRWGLDYPLGRGRTPLWFDADRDGRLDVVLMTAPRPDGKAPSAVFRQTSNGFVPYGLQWRFQQSQPSRLQKVGYLLRNLVHLDFSLPTWIQAAEFAQLADLSGGGLLDLVVFTDPVSFYSLITVPFDDFTHRIGFPADPAESRKANCWLCSLRLSNLLSGVSDAAIEDFDGDGHLDVYLVRPRHPDSEVIQTTPFEIRGTFAESSDKGDAKTLYLRTSSNVTFQLNVPWEGPSNPFRTPLEVAIGSSRKHTAIEPFTLTPDDPSVRGPVPAQATAHSEVSIVYDPASSEWMLSSSGRRLNFILRSAETIDQVWSAGLKPFDNQGADLLLVRRGERFITKTLPDRPTDQGACHSVAVGDFDNDMDIDIYLVCTGQAGNLSNRLLENDGHGNFTEVPGAGGAAGSKLGRGDAVAIADYDRDGFLDLFVTNGFGPAPFTDEGPHQLFRNQGNGNHWIEIDLEGTVSNRDGIGASVVLEAGGVVQRRGQGGGMHRDSQNHQRIHFGLAQHTVADRLTVRWPSGIQQQLEKVQADQILRIKERP